MITGIAGTVTTRMEIQHPAAFTTSINTAAGLPVKKNYDEDAKSWYAVYNTGNIIHVYLAITDPGNKEK